MGMAGACGWRAGLERAWDGDTACLVHTSSYPTPGKVKAAALP